MATLIRWMAGCPGGVWRLGLAAVSGIAAPLIWSGGLLAGPAAAATCGLAASPRNVARPSLSWCSPSAWPGCWSGLSTARSSRPPSREASARGRREGNPGCSLDRDRDPRSPGPAQPRKRSRQTRPADVRLARWDDRRVEVTGIDPWVRFDLPVARLLRHPDSLFSRRNRRLVPDAVAADLPRLALVQAGRPSGWPATWASAG